MTQKPKHQPNERKSLTDHILLFPSISLFCGTQVLTDGWGGLRDPPQRAQIGLQGCKLFTRPLCYTLAFGFKSFPEKAGAAERPSAREGPTSQQGTAAPLGPQKEPVRQRVHRLFLLRVKLMHFVNSLHNYIMTRVRVSCRPQSLLWTHW